MAHFERKTGGRLVYDGRVVKLHVDEVVLENSSPAVRALLLYNFTILFSIFIRLLIKFLCSKNLSVFLYK